MSNTPRTDEIVQLCLQQLAADGDESDQAHYVLDMMGALARTLERETKDPAAAHKLLLSYAMQAEELQRQVVALEEELAEAKFEIKNVHC